MTEQQQQNLPNLRFTIENEGLSFHPLFVLSVLKKIRGSVKWGRRPVRCCLPAAVVSDDGVECPVERPRLLLVSFVFEREGDELSEQAVHLQ